MRGTKLGWLVACAGLLWTLGGSLAGSTAEAQYIPRHCGMSYPDYGSVTVGSFVVLGRHTPWAGDSWWNAAMEGYVGRVARVTELGGLDPVGCPYIRVDADAGAWGWRIRDMSMAAGGGGGGGMPAAGGTVPSWCGMSSPTYGPITIGSRVILGAHDAVNGDTWWNDAMWAYVGREATVREFGGLDPQGCPFVRVDIDGAAWGWRIRNMTFMAMGAPAVIPTYCGMTYPDYGPLRVGSVVILGAHTPWNGETWWNDAMWPYVGRQATITELSGLDPNGCPYVHVNVDGAAWGWRIRNMSLVY